MEILVLLCCVVLYVDLARSCCSHEPKWQLVWSDEFTNGISSDWEFEIGNGLNGWGNNELQYYRRENAQVEGGKLVITAKREDYDGFKYTSARLKTQFKKSWKYGKIEAKMAMPSFNGVWEAFWMLGDNIRNVSWPSSGEIDIMEHINTNTEVRGTIHWSTPDGAYTHHGGGTNTNVMDYHIYSVEWNSSFIKWFVDGNQYFEVDIQGGVNGTSAFHKTFFIILNMAIGGNWPGFDVADEAFPAEMYIDYVRVYQDASTSYPVGNTSLDGYYFLQSRQSELYLDVTDAINENGSFLQQWPNNGNTNTQFHSAHLVNKSINKEKGKSLNVNNLGTENGVKIQQWVYREMYNRHFTIPSLGDEYSKFTRKRVKFLQVASFKKHARIKVQKEHSCDTQVSRQYKFIQSTYSKVIQAESYFDSSEVELENTLDVGGGKNVKCDKEGAWMIYKNIDFPSSGSYRIDYRLASERAGGKFSLDLNECSIVLGILDVPSTEGRQNWTTISHTVNVNSGLYNLRICIQRVSWNINWIKITKVSGQSKRNQSSNNSKLIQAESYFDSSGVQLEDTLDVGGGKNVKCDKEGAWMAYKDIDFPSSGSYRIDYRVASEVAGGKLSLDLNAGSIVLGILDVPSTGGLQNWTTISHTVNVNSGIYNLGIYVQRASWNLNWINITKVSGRSNFNQDSSNSKLIQAESYFSYSGVQLEDTLDVGGGKNVKCDKEGAWMCYKNIDFSSSGSYRIDYRVASEVAGGKLSLDLNTGSIVLGILDVPSTGGLQNWTTISHTVNVNSGIYNLGIYVQRASWNLNWINITKVSGQSNLNEGSSNSKLIQAESYFDSSGVQLEDTLDVGGGKNVKCDKEGAWMAYKDIDFPSSGSYRIDYRVASEVAGGKLSLDLNAGSIVLGMLDVPSTGGLQNWTTISHTVNVNSGIYNLGIYVQRTSWNLNWINITKVSGQSNLNQGSSNSKLIQAESYFSYSGVQLEDTLDVGGGKNVKCDKEGAWMAYKNIDFSSSGSYRVDYRVASAVAGGKLSLDLNAGSIVLGMLDVPSTGGLQNWTTISHTVNVNSGIYNLGIYVQRTSWNLNWINITEVSGQSNFNQDSSNSKLIQAESYFSYSGVQLEDTLDAKGGKNVKCDKEGAWMAYKDIDFPSSGSYRIDYRVASERAGGKLSLDLNAGSIVLGMLDVPSTGGLQNWTTISHTVNVNSGIYNLGIYVQRASWNLNWINITKVSGQSNLNEGSSNSKLIQAESYFDSSGVQLEDTLDVGGGKNVKCDKEGAWMAYKDIDFLSSGRYRVDYRVASEVAGGKLSLDLNAGSIVLGMLDVPLTGGLQNWTTISHTVNVNSGTYNLGISVVQVSWNINWIKITKVSGHSKQNQSSNNPKLIQAESYFDSSGVQLEDTLDVGGGKNVKCDKEGAWMAYKDIDFPSSGRYRVDYRVASEVAGGKLSLDLNAGSIVLGMLDVPLTGGLQNWTTISHTVNVNSGTFNLGISVVRVSWNINWIKITKVSEQSQRNQSSNNPKLIQAESYFDSSGVQLEDTLDVGGGKNVKCDKEGAWMAYKDIDFPSSGNYRVDYRVASEFAGGKLSLDLNAGSIVLGILDVPLTGGLQNWTTISHTVNVNSGIYNLGIYVQRASWNLNWINITKVSEQSNLNEGSSNSKLIQAESYFDSSGVQLEDTLDVGGGKNVKCDKEGAWMAYKDIDFLSSGRYRVDYRVASEVAGGKLSLDLNAGSIVLGMLDVPLTGGLQNWTTISHTVNVNSGTYNLGISVVQVSWNINWIKITKVSGQSKQNQSSNNPKLIQAESYFDSSGVQLEDTLDVGGGKNVKCDKEGAWMAYKDIDFLSSGRYRVDYRVASEVAGGKLSLDLNAGSIVLGMLDVPLTGGLQNWTTISHTVNVNSGTFNLGISVVRVSWNINWIKITKVSGQSQRNQSSNNPKLIQAESYFDSSGVQLEDTLDVGGGKNVKCDKEGAWMAYKDIDFPSSGNYRVDYRVASEFAGGKLSLDLNAGSIVLGILDVPLTGGLQNWTTISHTVNVNSGTYNLGISVVQVSWNINWIKITKVSGQSKQNQSSNNPKLIQAESYFDSSGVQLEDTLDVGGGKNVKCDKEGAWMAYKDIDFPVQVISSRLQSGK
ncbi:uncharacterized protein LOC143232023 isoform X3 [Tachypleus tridentatus]|uniref:uncharacterized protein LOC143232023 isoform X3 n=1 Tax=Tachypleus tridentatus TaxID=6853 RepID=UPI003FD2C6DF